MLYHDELRELMQQITDRIDCLKQLIANAQIAQASVYEIPPTLSGDEKKPVSYIPVTEHNDPFSATSMATHAFGQFFAPPESQRSTQSTLRLPGVLMLHSPHAAAGIRLVDEINQLKTKFSQAVIFHIPDVKQRFPILHERLFPGLITLQLYRQIIAINQPLQSIRFFWANKQSITCPTRDSLLEQLTRAQSNPGRSMLSEDFDAWVAAVGNEIALIKSLHRDTEFRIRRPVKVQPMVRFAPFAGSDEKAKAMACPLPVIVFLRQDTLPKIRPLTTYDETAIRHKRPPEPRQSLELLIPRLHLYRLV